MKFRNTVILARSYIVFVNFMYRSQVDVWKALIVISLQIGKDVCAPHCPHSSVSLAFLSVASQYFSLACGSAFCSEAILSSDGCLCLGPICVCYREEEKKKKVFATKRIWIFQTSWHCFLSRTYIFLLLFLHFSKKIKGFCIYSVRKDTFRSSGHNCFEVEFTALYITWRYNFEKPSSIGLAPFVVCLLERGHPLTDVRPVDCFSVFW